MDQRYKILINDISLDFYKQISSIGSSPVFVIVIVSFYLTGFSEHALFLLLGLISMYIIAIPMRIVFFKERPDPIPYTGIIEKVRAGAIPSLHSTRVIFLFLFLSTFFSESFEHRMFLGALALLVMYSRIVRKRHFLLDIFVGLMIGALIFYALNFYFPLPVTN